MLFYPGLIENTRKRLEETYQGITVTGSIVSTGISPEVPAVSGSLWKEIQESGYFSNLYASGSFSIRAFPKEILEEKAGISASEQEQLIAFQNLLAQAEEESGVVSGAMKAYNTFSAEDELVRIQDDIRWLDGYDETCLKGNERICIVSERWGYALGDTIPMLARVLVNKSYMEGIFRMKVVGTYPGKITGFAAVMPLKTMEDLTIAANAVQKQNGNYSEWIFGLNEVYFTVRDNLQLDQIKTMITEKGFRDSKYARVRIDDRILKETVGPIESNLAQLEGSVSVFLCDDCRHRLFHQLSVSTWPQAGICRHADAGRKPRADHHKSLVRAVCVLPCRGDAGCSGSGTDGEKQFSAWYLRCDFTLLHLGRSSSCDADGTRECHGYSAG